MVRVRVRAAVQLFLVRAACEDEAAIGRELDEAHGRVVVVDEGLEALPIVSRAIVS